MFRAGPIRSSLTPVPDDAHKDPSIMGPQPDDITFEHIRERAYELWERNHKPAGFEIEFWLLAERELRQERERRKPPGAAPPEAPQRSSE